LTSCDTPQLILGRAHSTRQRAFPTEYRALLAEFRAVLAEFRALFDRQHVDRKNPHPCGRFFFWFVSKDPG